MKTTLSEVPWQARDAAAADTPEAPMGGSRRLLLGGSAGGLVLAARGLFLPDWLDVTAAREGALGGAKGGRHGKNHRGRHRKRTHGDKKEKGKHNRQPGALIDGIRWGYYSEAGPFDVEFWVRAMGEFNPDAWRKQDARQVPNEQFVELRTWDIFGILWINQRYYFEAQNRFGNMSLVMGYGGFFTAKKGWDNGTATVFDALLAEGQLAPDMVVDGFRFTVERVADDADYKKPSLTIRKA